MKKIMVTGGAGFLGSHLCERLLSRGDEVLCVDNFYTGTRAKVAHLHDNPLFEVLRHDIAFPLHAEVDEIYNFACPASPIHYQVDPVQTLKTSVQGAINMLATAKETGAKIFQASTSEVYGDPLVPIQSEEYWGNVNPIGPRACYDEGKRCAETIFFDYHHQYGQNIRVARLFNTYGPRMNINDGRVVSTFVVQALKGEDLTVAGDGQQTRCFTYVDDTLDAIIQFMDGDDALIGPLNIGSDYEQTIYSIAEQIIEFTGSSSKIKHIDLPTDDPKQRRPDLSKIRRELNWEPTTGFEVGLAATVEYFEKVIREEN